MTRAKTSWTGVAFGLGLAAFAAYQQFKLPPVLPVLLEAYGYNRTLAGGFMSVYALAGLAFSIWIGRLLARRGIVGAVLGALGSMILGNAISLAWPESGWVVLVGRALEGVGFAVLAISGPLIANANAVSTHLPLIAGLTASWIPLGQLSAILLAEAAFAWADWRLMWLAAIAGSVLLGLRTLYLARNPRVVLTLGSRPPAAAPHDRPSASPDPAAHRSLRLAAVIFMLWSGQYFAYMTWLPQYLVEVFGLSAAGAVVGYTVPVVVLIATNLSVGWVLRLGVSVGRLLVFGLALQTATWWLVPWAEPGALGLLSLLAYGLGAGICPTCLFALPAVLAGPGRGAAAAFGVLMTGRNLGVLAGPLLLAQAFEITGGWHLAAPIFGALTGLALVLGLRLAQRLAGAGYGTRR